VRDALSLLEQVSALGRGSVEVEAIVRALGLADKDAFGKLALAISDEDAPAALSLVAELSSQGADLRRFVGEAIGFFRGVFLAQYAPNLEEVADEPLDTLEEWRRYADVLAPADVLRAVDGLSDALFELRQGREERLVVELALLRLSRPETAQDTGSLDARLSRLEVRVRDLAASRPSVASPSEPVPAVAPGDASEEPEAMVAGVAAVPAADVAAGSEPEPTLIDAVSEDEESAGEVAVVPPPTMAGVDLATVQTAWPAIVAQVRELDGPRRHALIKEATPTEVDEGTVVLEVPAHLPFHLEQLREDTELRRVIARAGSEVLGGSIGVTFRSADPEALIAAEPERAPDKDDLLVAPEDASDDPADLIVDVLGGEIVSD
jgi:DNA polymerase-3 subunit gamma/tau